MLDVSHVVDTTEGLGIFSFMTDCFLSMGFGCLEVSSFTWAFAMDVRLMLLTVDLVEQCDIKTHLDQGFEKWKFLV